MVRCGCDVLLDDGAETLRGCRVGLVTNHTGRDATGASTASRLLAAEGVRLSALFAPEHGLAGKEDREGLADGRDSETGLVVHSLYGERRSPDPAVLGELDALVFDIQDVGARFYTYIATLSECMAAAGEAGVRMVVLDRPNPSGGWVVEGPVLDPALRSFIGPHELPLRHGLTIGELATAYRASFGVPCELEVIPCEGWQRSMLWQDTGLPWIAPSPNLRTAEQALLYPGPCLLEASNLSVGRGTERPFELLGAPWCDGEALAERVAAHPTPGVRVEPTEFTPDAASGYPHAGRLCRGVRVRLGDPRVYRALPLGLALLGAFRDSGGEFSLRRPMFDRLLGSRAVLEAFDGGADWAGLLELAERGMEAARAERAKWLLYPE